jgi:hypothetical protein
MADGHADWTPQEVYDLRATNAAVYGLLADIRAAVGDPTGTLMQDELVAHCRSLNAEVGQLREAIRRLAEQDATLSVQGGNVTVTMDWTLTDAERECLEWCLSLPMLDRDACRMMPLRGLLERLG